MKIALVGKYVQLHDAYLSVAEALQHAGFAWDDIAGCAEWIIKDMDKTLEKYLPKEDHN